MRKWNENNVNDWNECKTKSVKKKKNSLKDDSTKKKFGLT